jgi:hypothetical protein
MSQEGEEGRDEEGPCPRKTPGGVKQLIRHLDSHGNRLAQVLVTIEPYKRLATRRHRELTRAITRNTPSGARQGPYNRR